MSLGKDGRRARRKGDLTVPTSVAADLRLFVLTFAAGFLFVSVLIA